MLFNRFFRQIAIMGICLVGSLELFAATTGKVAGKVTDAQTGEPLFGVNIIIQGTTLGAATDADGNYFIINIPPDSYTLEVSMMGYQKIISSGVRVNLDHTTTANFTMKSTPIEGSEVKVIAEREIIPMDISATQVVANANEVRQIPLVTDVREYINLQAGVENNLIRGGGLDQTGFMVDGLMVVDNRANAPLMMVNLSSIKEISIITGGFNAEYGNVRSGLINVVTNEGSPSKNSGSIDFRISPAHLKHGGPSLFSPDNWYLRRYLDPAVAFVGTQKGGWSTEMQNTYGNFMGWNAYSQALLKDSDPKNDMTPEQARDQFLWLHRVEGSGKLGQKEGTYGNKPDWNVDASFSGPVPIINKYLGGLSFFASYKNNWEMFALPIYREYYKEDNAFLKLTSRITPSMKLTVEGMYGSVNTVARSAAAETPVFNDYLSSATAIFSAPPVVNDSYTYTGGAVLYWPNALAPFDIYRNMQGLSFDHIINRNTFYTIRMSHTRVKNVCTGRFTEQLRDTTTLRYFGNVPVDESPYGFPAYTDQKQMIDGMIYAGQGSGTIDHSEVNTLNLRFDLTSQVNKYNQIKLGADINYDDIDSDYGYNSHSNVHHNRMLSWRRFPYRIGAYTQDKLEFEGFIANLGLRLDGNFPNGDWYFPDTYSPYYSNDLKGLFTSEVEKKSVKGKFKLSPRLGISHPISAQAKLYFNYGHFYSMPSSNDMYALDLGHLAYPIAFLGNPSADLPKTVAYELGVDFTFFNMFALHLAGYYKDVTNQIGRIQFTNYDMSVDYQTTMNKNYADIRGFELRFDKRFGSWITGWLLYDYRVNTSGYIGRKRYYQDVRMQAIYGLENPYQARPLPQPIARANVTLGSPYGWGPKIAGITPLGDLRLSLLCYWKAGDYMTWDPLQTFQLQDNLQWKDEYNFDLRLSKDVKFGKYNLSLFVDIKNLLDTKYIEMVGFSDGTDQNNYFKSLHLPMYKDKKYQDLGYVPGNDKPGDIKSSGKPYIDMPNRNFLTYLNVRSFYFGLRFNF